MQEFEIQSSLRFSGVKEDFKSALMIIESLVSELSESEINSLVNIGEIPKGVANYILACRVKI